MRCWFASGVPGALVIGAFLSLAISIGSGSAQAHDWFTGLNDPVKNWGCCSGNDCAAVPEDLMRSGVITERSEGYLITLTIEQARRFNKTTISSIRELVPWSRVQPGLSGGYALCIYSNHIQCFFSPSNT